MSRNEDLLRSAYRRPTDTAQLDRMQAFVRDLDAPPRRPASHRWGLPLSIAAVVAVFVTGTVLTVTADHGKDHPDSHPAQPTSTAAALTTKQTLPTTAPTTAPSTPYNTPTPAPHIAVVTVEPAFGSRELSPLTPLRITVATGALRQITVTDAHGQTVRGMLSADRTSWTSTGNLLYSNTYRLKGAAAGTDGAVVAINFTWSTLVPKSQVAITVNPIAGATVGVGEPVSLLFPAGLDSTDRAAIERRSTVTTSVPVVGAWGWIRLADGTWRLDWRPKGFWPANTRVQVRADLFGVRLAPGRYGKADVDSSFTVGRDQ